MGKKAVATQEEIDAAEKKKKARKPQARVPWKAPVALSRQPQVEPPWDSEETRSRVPQHAIRPGQIPQKLREAAHAAGLTHKPELPDAFRHAAYRQGRPHAEKMMRSAAGDLSQKGVRFGTGGFDLTETVVVEEDTKPKEVVLRPYTDQELRAGFGVLDLDKNDFIDAAELRHIFAQIGEMPSDNEISAMILLCDPRGDGAVNFDDFLAVFSNPAEALRNANIKGIKHLLPRKSLDFDVRDPLGLVLDEKTKLRETTLVVVEVRKGSQAHDATVKNGWKVVQLEGEMVSTLKDFETKMKKIDSRVRVDNGDKKGNKGRGKGAGDNGEPQKKKQIKYDYNIVFEILPGEGDSDDDSSEELEKEEDDDDDDDDDEDND